MSNDFGFIYRVEFNLEKVSMIQAIVHIVFSLLDMGVARVLYEKIRYEMMQIVFLVPN